MGIGKIFTNKKYIGLIWHLIFAGVFIGLSLLFMEFVWLDSLNGIK
jgi:formate/nitrite transporter FocA (FNT family)